MPKLRLYLSALLTILSLSAAGEQYYWVGGGGSWSEISHWATSSGGSSFHSVVPGIHDTVYFDANSGFAEGNNTVTINTGATCHTMIWDGAPNQPVLTNRQGFSIRVFGSLALQEAMTVEGNLRWSFRATRPGNSIQTSGNPLYDAEFNGSGGEWTLADALKVDSWDGSAIQLIEGSLRTNDQQVHANRLEIASGRPIALHLGSSEIYLRYSFYSYNYFIGADQTTIYLEQAVINIASEDFRIEHTPQEFDAGTSTINLHGTRGYFYAGFPGAFHEVNFFGLHATLSGQETSFHKVTFLGNGNLEGNNTFDSLLFAPGRSYRLQAGSTQTIVEYISLDTPPCTNPIIITSSRIHHAATLYQEDGEVNGSNLVLQDIHGRGGATFYANASIDLGNNDGWQFTPAEATDYYWVGGSGSWSDGSHWSLSSGGPPAHCIPTAFDNVFFDAASGFTPAANRVVIDGPAFCNDMTWNEAPNHPIFQGIGFNNLRIFGSLALQEAMTVDGNLQWSFRSTQPGNTITTSGNRLYAVEFNGSGGEWTLQDDLVVNTSVSLAEGIFRTNDQQVNAFNLILTGEQPIELHLGSSQINLQNSFYSSNNSDGDDQTSIYLGSAVINIVNDGFSIAHIPAVFDAGTSVINLYGNQAYFYALFPGPFHEVNFFGLHATLFGQQSIFHRVAFYGNGHIRGNNTFAWLVFSPGNSYQLQANRTQTIVEDISLDTTPCTSPIIITSNRMHTAATLSKADGLNGMNLVLQDIHAQGGIPFHANASVDLGNNAGWQITSAAPTNYYWIGGSGNWSDGSHWSLSSGGPPANCIPTASDNVFFDAASGFTTNADSVVIDGPAFCNNMTWSDAPNHPILTTRNKNTISIFGSLALQEAMTVQGRLQWSFRSDQPGNTIQTHGNQLYVVTFNGSGGEWTLLDALRVDAYDDSTILLIEGSLDTNDQQVDAGRLEITGGRPIALHLGSSEINLTYSFHAYNFSGVADQTRLYLGSAVVNIANEGFRIEHAPREFDAGTSVINLLGFHGSFYAGFAGSFHEVNFFGTNATLSGQEASFHQVVFYENGQVYGNNTFGRLLFSPGKAYRLEAGRTQTITEELEAKGNPCFIANLSSTNAGQQAFIQMHAPDTVVVDFIILRDIHATGGARFIGAPNTTDNGNNSGWDFTATPGNYIFGFGGDRELNCGDLPYLITTDSFNPNQGTTFLWSDNSSGNELQADEYGQYHILVSYADACSIRDTLVLKEPPMPEVNLGADRYLEPGEQALLDAGADDDHTYLWSTGATTSEIHVSEPGQYWVYVSNNYQCEAHDTIWVFNRPVVETSIPAGITSSSAVLGGEVVSDGGVGVTGRGVFWGLNPDPVGDGTQQPAGTGLGEFSYQQEGLQPNTLYYVTAYAAVAANEAATAYAENTPGLVTGSTESFRTLPELPVVETADPSAVMATSAVVGGSILSDGGLPITEKGVIWGSDPDLAQSGTRLTVGDGGWDFSVKLEGLDPNHLYHYVAFATNDEGTALGDMKSFNTLDTLPEVVTSLPEEVAAQSAVLGGAVIADGGAAVTDRGVFWGTDPDPVSHGTQQQEGAGEGAFSYLQEGLEPNTRYYVAAYAVNRVGTVYGNTETFVTEHIIPDLFIPNAFMPGSTHLKNQVFMPTFDILPPEYSLTIYNRWGQRLFITDNPEIGWDGTADNELAPHNSYSYTITYRYPNGKEHKHMGVFLLIR